jgi:hypothetical protein
MAGAKPVHAQVERVSAFQEWARNTPVIQRDAGPFPDRWHEVDKKAVIC